MITVSHVWVTELLFQRRISNVRLKEHKVPTTSIFGASVHWLQPR
jgi:hypothetical protein